MSQVMTDKENEEAMWKAQEEHYNALLASREWVVSYFLELAGLEIGRISTFHLPEDRDNCVEEAIAFFKEKLPKAKGWMICNQVEVQSL